MACKCPRCGRDVANLTVYGESPIKAAYQYSCDFQAPEWRHGWDLLSEQIFESCGVPEAVLNSTPFGFIQDNCSVLSREAFNRAAIRVQQEIERQFMSSWLGRSLLRVTV